MFFKDKVLLFIEDNEFQIKLIKNNSQEIITYSIVVFNKINKCRSISVCHSKTYAVQEYIKKCENITNKYSNSEENILNFLNKI